MVRDLLETGDDTAGLAGGLSNEQLDEIIDSERSRWVYGRDEHASGAFYQW